MENKIFKMRSSLNWANGRLYSAKEDLIIEIGPGLGTLTSILLEKAGKGGM